MASLPDRVYVLIEPPQTIMATSHDSRIFASGNATTLYVTIPAQVVSDSRFPFDTDDSVTVTIDGDQLGSTLTTQVTDE